MLRNRQSVRFDVFSSIGHGGGEPGNVRPPLRAQVDVGLRCRLLAGDCDARLGKSGHGRLPMGVPALPLIRIHGLRERRIPRQEGRFESDDQHLATRQSDSTAADSCNHTVSLPASVLRISDTVSRARWACAETE